jgi:hypothetical protein
MRFEKPSFVLTDRLPANTVAPLLLGRVVADIKHPTHEFAPKDPRPALKDETIEIADSNVSSVLSVVKNKVAKARIADILGFTLDDQAFSGKTFKSPQVKTETLQQHRDALAQVLEKHRGPVEELLARNWGKGYFIVGIKTCLDGERDDSVTQKTDFGMRLKAPTDLTTQIASHGTASAPQSVSVEIEARATREGSARSSFKGAGEQVFAIQYRTIRLKKGLLSLKKEPEVAYGDLKLVDFQDGVYGKGEKEMIYEDDQVDEGELDDERLEFVPDDDFKERRGADEDVCTIGE